MRLRRCVAAAVLAAACGRSRVGAPAGTGVVPASGTPPAVADPGAPSSPAGVSRAPYHLVSLATSLRKWSYVKAIAPNGLVLAGGWDGASPEPLYVVDAHTGARRDVDGDTQAVNASGILAEASRFSTTCAAPAVFLAFPDATSNPLPPVPLAPVPVGYACDPPQAIVARLADDLRLAATFGDYYGAHAYLWDGVTWQLQPPLETQAVAAALGAGTHVTGWSAVGNEDHAVLWRDGAVIDLGPGRAHDLNATDIVVGEQGNVATQWSGSTATPLPVPRGWQWSVAKGISDSGVVVGTLGTLQVRRGFVYAEGVVQDVNDLLDAHELLATDVLFVARDGTIAGEGLDLHGGVQAFAAVPTGAPLAPDTTWRDAGQVLARGEPAIDLAVLGADVVWIDERSIEGGWAVRRVATTGGAVETVAEAQPPEDVASRIALGGGYVYFRTFDASTTAPVRRVRLADGAVETVATPLASERVDFAADEQFWYLRSPDGAVVRVPHAGGDPLVLDTAPGFGVATDGSDVWYAVDGGTGPTIRGVARDGGAPRDLFAPGDLGLPVDVTIDAITPGPQYVYFTAGDKIGGATLRVPREGGAPERIAFDGLATLDASDGDVFWTRPFAFEAGGPGCVVRTAPDGSGAACLDVGPFSYHAARVDPDAVYFLRDLDVVRLAR
jgi:hypothetical protein